MITLSDCARQLIFYAVLLTACLYLKSEGNKLNRSSVMIDHCDVYNYIHSYKGLKMDCAK